MSIMKYLEAAPLNELTRYKHNVDYRKNAVSFTGSARKHPYDPDKLLLVSAPFSSETVFYEFRIKDVVHYEDLPGLSTDNGETLLMIRLWITKGSFALRYEPFEVDEPLKYLKDSELLHQVLKETQGR